MSAKISRIKLRSNTIVYGTPGESEQDIRNAILEEYDGNEDGQQYSECDSSLPIIHVHNRQLREISDDALEALKLANVDAPMLFVQSGSLVSISLDEFGVASIKQLNADSLRGIISRAANLFDKRGKNLIAVSPPIDMVRDIAALGNWPFPPIKAIVSTPIIRPDGSVLDEIGYDAATELYYQPSANLTVGAVPQRPTDYDVREALAAIDDIVHDFPYVSAADRANAYAAMLTPYIRMLVGCVPMALFEAPKQGTGKSLHAEILSIIQTGKSAEMTPIPTSEEEWTKTLAGHLRDGSTMIILDNIVGVLNSSVLASVLTSSVFSPRLLGKMTRLELHNTATWIATANNVRLGGDFPRRCYPIRLDAKVVSPEKREGFLHPNIKAHTREVRGKVIHALLTLVRAWYAAECPMPEERVVMGSFDEWASIIAGILHFVGIHGFLANVQTLHDRADVETPLWEGFFTEWERLFGSREITASDAAKQWDALKEYLPEYLLKAYSDRQETFSRKLGNALASQADVRYTDDGLRLERGGVSHKVQLWRVVRENGGSSSKPPQNPPASDQENSDLGGLTGLGGHKHHVPVRDSATPISVWEVTVGNPPNPQTPPFSDDDLITDGTITLEDDGLVA